jgi:two-component SAPR family response regulator
MEAYAMNIERYLLRPFSSERIREEIQLLQTRRSKTNYEENERAGTNEKIRVRCFGSFAVFWQNKPLLFSRKKTVELLAFLVDRAGACCDRDEVMDMLFENDGQIDQIKTKQKLRNLIFDLQSKLALIGQQELLIHSRSMLAVRPDLIDCDYYRYLEGDSAARNEFRGEYMEQFSWAENTKGWMTFQFEKNRPKT